MAAENIKDVSGKVWERYVRTVVNGEAVAEVAKDTGVGGSTVSAGNKSIKDALEAGKSITVDGKPADMSGSGVTPNGEGGKVDGRSMAAEQDPIFGLLLWDGRVKVDAELTRVQAELERLTAQLPLLQQQRAAFMERATAAGFDFTAIDAAVTASLQADKDAADKDAKDKAEADAETKA